MKFLRMNFEIGLFLLFDRIEFVMFLYSIKGRNSCLNFGV